MREASGELQLPVLEGELGRLEASLDVKDVLHFRYVCVCEWYLVG